MGKDKVIVTGGAGFIGSHLSEELVRRGCDVVVIDNLSTGCLENLENIRNKIRFVEGDICDTDLLVREFKDAVCVFHQAAIPSVPRSARDPHGTNRVNLIGTQSVLEASKRSQVGRVVYASSSSVYGDSPTLPKREEMPMRPISRYALQKATDEHYAKRIYRKHGLETVGLRYFNVFGPRQNPDSEYAAVIPIFIKKILNNEQPTIYGDGTTTRDFTYVVNVVNANILAGYQKDIAGEVFNIASGKNISLSGLVETINNILGKDIKPKYADFIPGDVRHSLADIAKAKSLLGFEVKVDFQTGITETIEYNARQSKN